MSDERSTHRPLAFLIGSVTALTVLCLALSWRALPPLWSGALFLLLIAVVVSENFALDNAMGGSISISFPLTIAGTILLGPTSAALIGIGAVASIGDLRRHKPPARILYNCWTIVLVTLATGWTYVGLGGRVLGSGQAFAVEFVPLGAADFPYGVVPLTAAAAVAALGNVAMTALAMSVAARGSFRARAGQLVWVVQNEFALAFVGFFIAQVLAISLLGLVLFVAPLAVARQVYQRYMQLRESYVDTVKSLVGVLEAKDPYTRGHSERVAGYAAAIGVATGLEANAAERLEYAALLHDIGKVAIARSILVKPGRLSEFEYARIREHPVRGAEIVSKVASLRDVVEPIRYHHEWYDGRGYCEGRSGEDIPLMSRILAVADAFDAMTTARPYRPARTPADGIIELMRMSGSQFDPEMVDAFVTSGACYLYSPATEVESELAGNA